VPCPGDVQAQFQLSAVLVDGAACQAAIQAAAAPALAASISFTGADAAAVCPSRPLAEPILGARSGDVIDVVASAEPAAASGCTCSVRVVERVSGTVTRDATGAATGFTGELVDEVAAADGGPCTAAAGSTCLVPCAVRWALTGSR
jgi:hypothetical protein